MKNLKRALSFAVAAVMLVGMMAVGTSAFTDDADIENTTAVNVMNQLNIITGKPDGSYDPTANVSRAEMAKMICVALNGGKDPKLEGTGMYTDTVGTWAAGYIDYCSNLGIVAGYNGLFRPTDSVTGTEAAKMLLIAIGYVAENEGFVNDADWAMNINVIANQKGLYEDLTILPAKTLTRDEAAQMIYNALSAVMVRYTYQLNSVNGNLTSVAVAQDDGVKTILNQKFKMGLEVEGLLTDVEYVASTGKYRNTVGGLTYLTDKDFSELFMQNVIVLRKTDGTVFGMYADGSKVLASTTVAVVDGNVTSNKLTIDKVEYEFDSNSPTFYAFLSDAEGTPDPEWAANLIDNDDDDKVDCVVVFPSAVKEVTYVGTKSFTVDGLGNKNFDDDNIVVYDGIAEEDWAVVVHGVYNVKGDTVITKADVVTGKVQATKSTDIKVNGEWLKQGAGYSDGALTIGTEYDIVVVNGYYYAADEVDEVFTAADLVYVMNYDAAGTGLNTGTQKAKVMFSDGTSAIVTVDKIGTKTITSTYKLGGDASVTSASGLYTFKTDKDGNYELTAIDAADYAAADTISNIDEGKADNGYRFNADAVIWVSYENTKAKVVSGADVNKWANASGTGYLFAEKKGGYAYTQVGMFTVGASAVPGNELDACYGMVIGDPYLVKVDDDTYTQLTIWNGTANVELVYEGDYDAIPEGALLTYEVNGNEMSNVEYVLGSDAVVAYDGTFISFEDIAQEYEITEDTVIVYIDTDEIVGVEGGKIVLASKDANGAYIENVSYVLDTVEGEVLALFVDVNNNWQF